jgi:acetyltransferase-like isoleucine patch superfamily enzyme
MSWLESRPLPAEASASFSTFLSDLESKLSNEHSNRNELCRELLAQFLYARRYADLEANMPMVALNLDPRNVTLEAEYYAAVDPVKFARVKPLLWLWYNFDLSSAAGNVDFAVRFRRVLAGHIFQRVGRNFKAFTGVQFSVGYNLSVGDDVVVHRGVLIDDIGGVTLHDRVSLSDFVNVYSHTHSPLEPSDVTLKHTTIGIGVRVTYHATVLAGVTLSDDSIVGAFGLATKDVPPHAIAVGIPALAQREKLRGPTSIAVDSRVYTRPRDRKGNADYPLEWDGTAQTKATEITGVQPRAMRDVVKRSSVVR